MKTHLSWFAFTLCLGLSPFAVAQEKANESSGKLVSIEVALVEVSPRGDALGGLEAEEKVVARIRELESQGKLAALTRVRLSTLENQPASAQHGERAPVVSGRTFGPARGGADFGGGRAAGGGPAAFTYTMMNYGTLVSATPRVDDDGSILIHLQVERSGPARKARAEGVGDGDPAAPPTDATVTTRTTVRVPNGKTVIAHAMESASEKDSSQTIVLVTARVSPSEEKRGAKLGAGDAERPVKIFALKHAKAQDAVSSLSVLQSGKPTRIAVDERTNMLIVRGAPDDLQEIEAILIAIDRE